MRTIISILLLAILVTGLGIGVNSYIEKSSADLLENAPLLEEMILQENWHEALKYLDELSKKWNKYETVWAVFLHHPEIDNIELSIERLKGYLLAESKSALGEAKALNLLIKHIPEMSKFNLKNVF